MHLPVLPVETVAHLGGERGAALEGWIVDGTVGAGGHAALLLEAFPRARLLGLDQDPQILEHAREKLRPFGPRVRLRRARLSQLGRVIDEEGLGKVSGVLLDLGASSLQLDTAARGFSFTLDGPLDMRMDPDRTRTAADIVNTWDEEDLADLFYHEGGETRSRKIARGIVEARRRAPFLRTGGLAELVARELGRAGQGKTHPATRVFQALRRAVNEEDEELLAGLSHAEEWLVDFGRLVVLAFHSGEDAVVKRFLSEGEREGRWRAVTRKPVRAGREELLVNRRARSAILRAGERVRRDASARCGAPLEPSWRERLARKEQRP